MLGMGQVVRKLRREGLGNSQEHIIRHGISVGSITRPELVSGRFIFNDELVRQTRRYLRNVPAPGRKSAKKNGQAAVVK